MGFQQESRKRAIGIVACMALGLMLAACSSHEPKPMAQPTPDQVRGHADRGFDKLKQEEQERGVQSNVPH
jgi:putative hemolysin